jgi:hypothetical protein
MAPPPADFSEVLELPEGADDSATILLAAIRHCRDLIECPLRPPMLESARLVIDRDRRLILFAAAADFAELESISAAFSWLSQNRPLIAMALPQLNIDAPALPQLRLLIPHGTSADAIRGGNALRPLLQSSHIQVQTYRKVRWSGKTGLLLEAA